MCRFPRALENNHHHNVLYADKKKMMTQNVQSTEQYADIYMNLGEIENQNNQHNQDQPKKKSS